MWIHQLDLWETQLIASVRQGPQLRQCETSLAKAPYQQRLDRNTHRYGGHVNSPSVATEILVHKGAYAFASRDTDYST